MNFSIFIHTYFRNLVFIYHENGNINGLNNFGKTFLYATYADDANFFLEDEKSVAELMKTFDIFSTFSGLKPNKSEIAGLGPLNGVKVALCGMECSDLSNLRLLLI